MSPQEIIEHYAGSPLIAGLADRLTSTEKVTFWLKGLKGSQPAFIASGVIKLCNCIQVFVLPDKESAAYFHNDLETLFEEREKDYQQRRILFFPTTGKRSYEWQHPDSSHQLMRTEVLSKLLHPSGPLAVVTYPDALAEKVIDPVSLRNNVITIQRGDQLSLDFVVEFLLENNFERVDLVVDPGQFAIRGGILDVFSFSEDNPYRIEFVGNHIESLRTFDPASQLSLSMFSSITIIPDIHAESSEPLVPFTDYLGDDTIFWFENHAAAIEKMDLAYQKLQSSSNETDSSVLSDYCLSGKELSAVLQRFSQVEFGSTSRQTDTEVLYFDSQPQPSFNKNFELLLQSLKSNQLAGLKNIIFTSNLKQAERLHAIFRDIQAREGHKVHLEYFTIAHPIHAGFFDITHQMAVYTDHQIFDRYHRYHLRETIKGREALTLRELYNLQPGDYVTHIDHGIGRFDGLEIVDNNGKLQEAIRLVYKDGDLLYVSIHSLHRISKYIGKEGTVPQLSKLGTNHWARLKERTKKKVKDIARDLIMLYSARRAAKGFAFSPDSYLQHELEASFIYEDTPDQIKATLDVKSDMEREYPMDRLICGDVGFGKTEVAVRAAFKAVADSKQVAVLVPTTILALQHYKTFSQRLAEFPVKVEYINRFKSSREQHRILRELEEGSIDIIIGTHRLVSNDVKFKDLGLLIIDEEQKFGVAVKEKLKKIKINVDTLTLTATPIPRTLQFSLMGARDLSVINTPPPNRIPIHTEIRGFSEEFIREAIYFEVNRGGQVFFVHNRVQNINDMADIIRKICPDVRVGVGHGQLDGAVLEQVMLDFIEGDYDVLVATTIIENGLDIPNANTIIINEAHQYGLSDLHQLRGRVGRANRQAFCYLLTPPLSTLTPEARKRLKAIEEFSSLGSGFYIAMRDLDIRGAGNLLGAEQSGFITEIGFEMYNKILDEALQELKEEEFPGLLRESAVEMREFKKDCQIETDLQILIPPDYISSTSERLMIYKELDNARNEEELENLASKLTDRFGPLPGEVRALFDIIRLRWIASNVGLEKVLIRSGQLVGYFPGNQDSPYYQSDTFTHVLNYIKDNPHSCFLRQNKQKLTIKFRGVNSVQDAINKLKPLVPTPVFMNP